jgi:lysozyme family protein
MKANWDKAISFALDWEGEYSWDKDDPGGETKWGVSKRAYPELIIKELTKEECMAIHKKDRWDAMKCDDLPDKLDVCVFDCALNMGIGRAEAILNLTQDWRDYLMYRVLRYNDLGKAKPMFLRGWINRAVSLWKILK